MNEDLRAAKFLFDKIKRVYPTFQYPDELDVEVWTEVLAGYSQTDILSAFKSYRANTEYNKAPNPGQFKKHLETSGGEVKRAELSQQVMTDYASIFMSRDISLGRNRHLLPVYRRTVRYVVEDLLSKEIPTSEWSKMDFGLRCEAAAKRGLFVNFDDLMVKVCRHFWGRDYQYDSANMLGSRKIAPMDMRKVNGYLSAHFGLSENDNQKYEEVAI